MIKDLRWLLLGPGLWGPAGTMAVTVALLPHSMLDLPWPARLAIGVAGAVMAGLIAIRAWRWVLDGSK